MKIDPARKYHTIIEIKITGDLKAEVTAEPLARLETALRDLQRAAREVDCNVQTRVRNRPFDVSEKEWAKQFPGLTGTATFPDGFRSGIDAERPPGTEDAPTVDGKKPIPPPLRGQAAEEALKHQAVKLPPFGNVPPPQVPFVFKIRLRDDEDWQSICGSHPAMDTAAPPAAEPFEPVTKEGDGIFDRAMTDAERVSVRQYLMDPWGISVAAAAIEAEPFEQTTRPYAMSCEKCRLTPPRGYLNAAATRFFCGSCYRGGAR